MESLRKLCQAIAFISVGTDVKLDSKQAEVKKNSNFPLIYLHMSRKVTTFAPLFG